MILAANDLPSINDITYIELVKIISMVKEIEDRKEYILGIGENNIIVMNSRGDLLVIDLSYVSPKLAYNAK
ncbi:hypothetical protein SUGI_0611200 [Cryptomeria japonica]|nr:hypothetical protein SUGI_0611200 [Cryptomeria japonica]